MAGLSAVARPVVPVFEVVFTGGGAGGCCRGPLGELWATPFERAAPVRSFPSFRGQVSFPGLYYAATMDAHVGFESWLERDVAMMLDFDREVVMFSSQPFWLVWAQDGDQRRHVPDYFARLADLKFRTFEVGGSVPRLLCPAVCTAGYVATRLRLLGLVRDLAG